MSQTVTVQTRITAKIEATTTVADDVRSVTAKDVFGSAALTLDDGDGANEANLAYVDAETIAASGSKSYDLDAGTLEDSTGRALIFDIVKAVAVKNVSTKDADVTVSGNLLGTMETIPISPGGSVVLVLPDADGIAVAPGADTLIVTNESGSYAADVEVMILGVALTGSGS